MQRITRRRMLKRSAGTAAVASGVVTLARPTYARLGANEEIQVGVVGFNGQGGTHIQSHQSASGVRVAALCDVDERVWGKGEKRLERAGGSHPKFYHDVRELLENKTLDAVSVATCNHWHALATIWACQAGKDVYVEKPGSWCVVEGRRMVEAARKYNRIVQHGTQSRSSPKVREAIARLHAGAIGDLYMARGLCFKSGGTGWNTRGNIGFFNTEPPPQGLHFDTWLGPAPKQPFHRNLVHYRWHWFWDFGNGDMGNQGIHQMDIARWGLNAKLPVEVTSSGGRFTGEPDQGETPNILSCAFTFEDGKQLVFETRGLPSNEEQGTKVGNLFYGVKGWMASGDNWTPRVGDKSEAVADGELAKLNLPEVGGSGSGSHFGNFHEAMRSRNRKDLNADIEEGHYSCVIMHMGNIAYRLGRTLKFDPKTERFIGDDEANALLTRPPRPPFVVPETPQAV